MNVKPALLLVLLAASASLAGQTTTHPRIISPIDESRLVPLRGNVHPLAQARFDQGPAPASMPTGRLTLILQRSAAQQQALTAYLGDLQNSASPNFHHWLTPAQFGTQFGPADADIQTVTAWLQGHGFKIERLAPARNFIQFSGTIDQIQNAFHTAIHTFSVHGAAHLANVTDPQIPQALAPVIAGISPLNDFHAQPNLALGPQGHYDPSTHAIQPNLTLFGGNTPYLFVDPADAATIYDTPNAALNSGYSGTSYDGSGINIGIAGDSDLTVSDVQNYRVAFLGESAATANLPVVVVDGNDPGLTGSGTEAVLDNEIAGAIAPRANLYFYTSGGNDLSDGLLNAMQRAVNDNVVSILSVSFGNCEAALGTAGNQLIAEVAEQAAAQGISITVSSGDGGSAGCDNFDTATAAQKGFAVNAFASTPYTIAVGGTDFDALPGSFSTYANTATSGTGPYYGTALRYIPENPWNDSTSVDTSYVNNVAEKNNNNQTNIVAGSGGVSSVYAKPAFQTSVTPSDNARDLPDVSLFASNGHKQAAWVFCSDNVTDGVTSQTYTECQLTGGQFSSGTIFGGVGGTSVSAPAFAGILALVEQKTGSRLGQADEVLYQLASSKYSAIFHDVSVGNNSVPCVSGSPNCGTNGFLTGYDAGTGYDLATGLGSVDVNALVTNWSSASLGSTSTSLQLNGSAAGYSGTHGANVTFNVGVNPSGATGSVAILDTANETSGGTANGPQNNGQFTIPLSSGSGTATYNGLPGGTYTVSARYAGDASNAASTSAPISVTISPEPSTTVLQVNTYNPVTATPVTGSTLPYGTVVFADAHIEGTAEGSSTQGLATGTVTFSNSGTTLGTVNVGTGGIASWPSVTGKPTIPSPGSYSYSASYSGDASYNSSSSATVPLTIVRAATTLTLNAPSMVYGIYGSYYPVGVPLTIQTPYTLGPAPTGTITTTINGQNAGANSSFTAVAQGSGASETWLISTYSSIPNNLFVSGPNSIVVTYSGDANYAPSTASATITDSDGVGSFSMNPSGNLSFIAGLSGDETIAFTPSGGFYGYVYVSVSGVPTGMYVSGSFLNNAASIGLLGSGGALDLHLSTDFSLSPGTYPITLIGKDITGKLVQSATFNVVLSSIPANAGITLSNGGPVSVAANSTTNNSGSITLTPVNGFVGPVSFTCAVTTSMSNVTSPPTCQNFADQVRSSVPAAISIPFTTTKATAAGIYTVTLTATDTLNSAITATTSFTLTITSWHGVFITIDPFSLTFPAGASSGNTLGMTFTPSGGYTGTVNVTCLSIVEPPNPNSPAQCDVPSSVNIPSASSVTATLTVVTTPATTPGGYDYGVNIYDAATGTHFGGTDIAVVVQAGAGLTVANGGGITLAPGATSGNTSTITVTPLNGFTGAVNLSCSLTASPSGATDLPTCSIPSSVNITGSAAVTASLTVTTTAPGSASLERPLIRFFAGGGAVLAAVFLFGIPARRRAWRSLLTVVAVLAITSAVIACGGGSGSVAGGGSGGTGSGGSGNGGGGQPNPGTTPGVYTITVTAKDAATGTITASSKVTLTVN
ncbi:MAG TPA: protease pro-enzyme activation domain-containing protein [Acidobacteriaceae bacterium]|nr:protease pro-enzyme activation domain-containing protein [Acidobacteriaceae bacterium]